MARSGFNGDLGEALAAGMRASGRRPTGLRRTRSNNPARVGINEELRRTNTDAAPGENRRTPGAQPVPGGTQLSLFDQAELGLLDPVQEVVDRTEVLSPPNSIATERPRAREARYDPDRKLLTVRFRNGGTYAYEGVPAADWRALKRNKSFGQTLDRLVINQYPFSRVSY